MKIVILNSDPNHPINPHLERLTSELVKRHQVEVVRTASKISGGQILFLVSCNVKVSQSILDKFEHCLVLHASDLPKGRGWSPHVWELINRNSEITVTMLEARDRIDTGDIYAKKTIKIPRLALWDEINSLLFSAEIDMMKFAVDNYQKLARVPQNPEITPTYYRKRTPADSKLDISKSISEQFDLIRVCDPNRFPAYFEIGAVKYKLTLEKI